ncbi:hypothetical protein MRS44_013763 [Fusarium solani]|uniref:uncharacterized protein n=1 Tax=Fusarium solani TaxID=169388 RepID=UPI0032C44EBE|nr:hypothetical protein MRS44_013763 [Fusarium solani]
MPEAPKKRGRPRKYDTPEEKARQDVIAKRARRRLRSSSVHGDIRFQVYVPQPIEALRPPSSLQRHTESTSCLGVLANAASRSDRAETPPPPALNHITSNIIVAGNGLRPQPTEESMLVQPCLQNLLLLNCAVMLGVIDKIKVIIIIVMVRAP